MMSTYKEGKFCKNKRIHIMFSSNDDVNLQRREILKKRIHIMFSSIDGERVK